MSDNYFPQAANMEHCYTISMWRIRVAKGLAMLGIRYKYVCHISEGLKLKLLFDKRDGKMVIVDMKPVKSNPTPQGKEIEDENR